MKDDMTWCVSRGKPIARWKNVWYIVKDTETYIVGAILLLLSMIAGYFLTNLEEKPRDLLFCAITFVQVITALTPAYNPKNQLMRFFYAYTLIVPFWLTQIIGAYLTTIVSAVLYQNQIQNTHDIIRHDIRLAGDPQVLDYLNVEPMVRHSIFPYDSIALNFLFSFPRSKSAALKSVTISTNVCSVWNLIIIWQ